MVSRDRRVSSLGSGGVGARVGAGGRGNHGGIVSRHGEGPLGHLGLHDVALAERKAANHVGSVVVNSHGCVGWRERTERKKREGALQRQP